MKVKSTKPGQMDGGGFTLIELLIVLAILGIFLGLGSLALRPPSVQTAADSMGAFIQQARFEAIKRNRPILVRTAEERLLLSEAGNAEIIDCAVSGPELRTLKLAEFRGVEIEPVGRLFAWLPNGEVRGCADPMLTSGNVMIRVSDGNKTATVVVGGAGQVSVE